MLVIFQTGKYQVDSITTYNAFAAFTFFAIPSVEKQARNNSLLVGSRPAKGSYFTTKKIFSVHITVIFNINTCTIIYDYLNFFTHCRDISDLNSQIKAHINFYLDVNVINGIYNKESISFEEHKMHTNYFKVLNEATFEITTFSLAISYFDLR